MSVDNMQSLSIIFLALAGIIMFIINILDVKKNKKN